MERGDAPRQVDDGKSEPQVLLQDPGMVQEAGEDEGEVSTPAYGIYTARERGQAAGIPRVPPIGVADNLQHRGYRR